MRCLAICFAVDFMFFSPFCGMQYWVATNLKLGFSVHNGFVCSAFETLELVTLFFTAAYN